MSSSDHASSSASSSRKRKHDNTKSDESIESLSPNDVLLGRGQHVKNGGNSKFRALVRANSAEYNSSRRKGGKDVIARRIIQAFLADGGRFVKRKEPPADSAMHEAMLPVYELADEATVLVKVKQTMRDYSVVLRKAAAAASASSNNTAAAPLLQPNPIDAATAYSILSNQTSVPTVAALHSLAINNPAAAVLQFSTTDQLLQMLHQAQQQQQQQLQQQQSQQQQQQLDALRAVLSGQTFNTAHDNTATTQSPLAFLNSMGAVQPSSYPQLSLEHDSLRMEIPPSMGIGGESGGTSTRTQVANNAIIPSSQQMTDGRAAVIGETNRDTNPSLPSQPLSQNAGPGHDPHMHALLLALMQGSSSTNSANGNNQQ